MLDSRTLRRASGTMPSRASLLRQLWSSISFTTKVRIVKITLWAPLCVAIDTSCPNEMPIGPVMCSVTESSITPLLRYRPLFFPFPLLCYSVILKSNGRYFSRYFPRYSVTFPVTPLLFPLLPYFVIL